jgi:D-alanyl-D-alanine carboxypeptidase
VNRGRHRQRLAAGAAIAVIATLCALVPAASGHVTGPTVTAQHAFIGDPLWGLDTTEGSLFGIAPDEQTAMASSTKLMTLDVAVHAIDAGVVSANDQVVVDAFAAMIEPNNSVMADVNGVTLEPGEIVRLDDLIRGMMYPSGNDAAWAIAFYVANAYGNDVNGDSVVDGCDFVELMNQHALDIGLTDTHFTSANGWDDPGTSSPPTCAPDSGTHFTTARELAMTMEHGLEGSPYFQQVVGFVGTWTATSQGPNGPKTYIFNFPFFGPPPTFGPPPPGWEGGKGGGTTNCNGPNNGCMGASAQRIGRRVVLAFMQGQPWSEEPGMFDYGFGQIFHPDPRGVSAPVGAADRFDVVCGSSSRCVSAALPPSAPVKVVSWEPDVDGQTVSVLDEDTVPKSALPPGKGPGQGPDGDVALTTLPSGDVIVANRKGSSAELSHWSLDGAGALTLLQDGVKAGPGTTMAVQAVGTDLFLTAITDPDGDLVVKSWQVAGSGLTHLDTYRDESRVYNEVAAAGPLTTDVFSGHRAATSAVTANQLVHHTWTVDPATGAITRLGELAESIVTNGVEISPFFVNTTFQGELFPPVYYATAIRLNGNLAIRFYRISASGNPVLEDGVVTAFAAADVGVAPLGTGGVMSARRSAGGTVELIAWDARRNADNSISADQISQHTAADAGLLELARVPTTHADGDYVTAVTDPVSGELRLRAYRSGDRPY